MNRFEKLRLHISGSEGKTLSAKKFSRLLGFSPNLFGAIERGDIPPSKKMASILEEKYGVSRAWFLTGVGPAPWDGQLSIEWAQVEEIRREIAEGKREPGSEKSWAGFLAMVAIKDSPESELLDFFIRAGREPAFRAYIYNVLEHSVKIFDELQESRERIRELEAASGRILPDLPARKVAEKDT